MCLTFEVYLGPLNKSDNIGSLSAYAPKYNLVYFNEKEYPVLLVLVVKEDQIIRNTHKYKQLTDFLPHKPYLFRMG